MKQITNYWRYLQVIHVRIDNNVKNGVESMKKGDSSHNCSNIISIS